jgi:hypothetical protein
MFKHKHILIFLNDSYGSHRISGYRPVWISFEKKNTLLGGICLLAKKKIRLAYMYVELSTWHMSVGNVWAGGGIWHLAYGNTWFTCMSRALTMAFGKYPSRQKKNIDGKRHWCVRRELARLQRRAREPPTSATWGCWPRHAGIGLAQFV